jgi:hypothetical protein
MPVAAAIVGGIGSLAGAIGQGAAGVGAANAQQGAAMQAMAAQAAIREQAFGSIGDLKTELKDIFGFSQANQRSALRHGVLQGQRAMLRARDDLGSSYGRSLDAIKRGSDLGTLSESEGLREGLEHFGGAQDVTRRGFSRAQESLSRAGAGARGDILSGSAQAQQTLRPGLDLQRYAPGAAQAVGGRDVTGARSRLGEFFEGGGQIDLKANPAYQARREAALEAADMTASAEGGRGGSAAERRRMQVADRLAANEYERAYGRQTQLAGSVDAQQQGLLSQQASREQQANLAAQSNQMRLAQQGFNTAGALSGLQAGTGSQLAGLGMQVGRGMGNLQAQQGQALSGIFGQQAAMSQAARSRQAQMIMQSGLQQAGTLQNLGRAQMGIGQLEANLGMQGAQALAGTYDQTHLVNSLMGLQGMSQNLYGQNIESQMIPVQYAGGDLAAIGNTFGTIGNMAGSLMGAGVGGAIGKGGRPAPPRP